MQHINPMSRHVKFALAGLAFGLGCTATQAQTNVTLYGRVSAGIDYQSNVATKDGSSGSLLRAAGNQWGTSMFGFKGNEDLGGGLNAFFLLESGFDATKGTANGGALFNRRSYVGVNGSAGSLKLGKNLSITNDVWYLDPAGQQFIGSATLVHGRNWQNSNNVIEYQTPTWAGFNATFQTNLGEQPGSVTNGRKDAASLVYINGGLELRTIYEVARDNKGEYSSIYAQSKDLIVGGTYTIDKTKLFAGYENLRASNAAPNTPDKVNHYWLGVNYQVSPALTLIGAGFRANANNGGGSANLFMGGVTYSLSKRTMLYATLGTVRNSKDGTYSVEATDNSPMPGKNQNGAYLGVVHNF